MSGSRVEKYESNSFNEMSRTKKNKEVYSSTDLGELSRLKTNTNVSIISDAPKEIDLEKIRNYVNSMNNDNNDRHKRISLELPEEEEIIVERKEEKEYDINSVLERAHDQRNIDYEVDRHRKINDTKAQMDILKNIKIKEEKYEKDAEDFTGPIDELNTEEKTIVDLIQSIQNKPTSKKELLDDLMGDEDDTIVMGMGSETSEMSKEEIKEALLGITQNLEEFIKPENEFTQTMRLEKEKIKDEINEKISLDEISEEDLLKDLDSLDDSCITSKDAFNEEKNEIEVEKGFENEDEEDFENEDEEDFENEDAPKISTIDKSFYTNSMTFNKTDFEGFEDLEKSARKSGAFTKFAIVLIIVMLLATIFLILNFVFDWGLL